RRPARRLRAAHDGARHSDGGPLPPVAAPAAGLRGSAGRQIVPGVRTPGTRIRAGGRNMKLLVTGAAGFIGMHSCMRLLGRGHEVFGIDNLNAYYDPALKLARLERLKGQAGFSFEKLDIADE